MHIRMHMRTRDPLRLARARPCAGLYERLIITRAKRIMGRGPGGRVREGPGEGRETPSEGRNDHKPNDSARQTEQTERFRTRSKCPPRALSHNAHTSMRAHRVRTRVESCDNLP